MLISSAAALTGGTLLLKSGEACALSENTQNFDSDRSRAANSEALFAPVVTPNGATLKWELIDGIKVFHLVAEPVKREFAPGLDVQCWGYNGLTPGPTIEAVEGDRCRIYVTNKLPEPTSVHWHGIILPNGMDGVSGLTQRAINPGETFKYEFTLQQHGTFMYHPHYDEMTQMALGMMGMFVVHPREPKRPAPDRDFVLMLSEWKIEPGTSRPDPSAMSDFNILTFNSRVYPGTAPMVVKKGERVRIRLGNLGSMDHHAIHIHGYNFQVTGTDGGPIPESAWCPATTVLVSVGTTRDIEFTADKPGDWPFHCHMTHHVMNQMGHNLPNLTGAAVSKLDENVRKLIPGYMTMGEGGMGEMGEMAMPGPKNSLAMRPSKGPFGTIDMGGMFTIIKVREGLASYEDPGWYSHPAGSVAEPASADELRLYKLES